MRVSTLSADRESSSSPVVQPFSVTSGAAPNLSVPGPAPSLPPSSCSLAVSALTNRRHAPSSWSWPAAALLLAQRCTASRHCQSSSLVCPSSSSSPSPPPPLRVRARVERHHARRRRIDRCSRRLMCWSSNRGRQGQKAAAAVQTCSSPLPVPPSVRIPTNGRLPKRSVLNWLQQARKKQL